MNDRRRALGRGLGALIPSDLGVRNRPVDTFFASPPPAPVPDAGEDAASARDGGPDGAPAPRTEGLTQDVAPEAEPGGGERLASGDAVPGSEQLRPVPGAQFAQVPVDAIRPNPRQPRQTFDAEELAELVHSIGQVGVLQPIVVRPVRDDRDPHDPAGDPPAGHSAPDGSRFELVMGERRWRAAKQAGLEHVPAIVKHTENDALLRDALLENLHRSQLNPLEEAAAYQQLLDDFGCTKEELASRIGRSRPQVSNTLRLLGLPPLVQRRVAAGVLSAGHARALLGLSDSAAIERLAARIVAEGLSVRAVEEIVAMGAQAPTRRTPRRSEPAAELTDVAARLSDRFDTRVHVAMGQRKGRLTIEFASGEDLGRILDVMGLDLS